MHDRLWRTVHIAKTEKRSQIKLGVEWVQRSYYARVCVCVCVPIKAASTSRCDCGTDWFPTACSAVV